VAEAEVDDSRAGLLPVRSRLGLPRAHSEALIPRLIRCLHTTVAV